ncbi:hypothetical protein LCGC14_0043380 [marine sediment metagenome]|uniref:Uncharacterized protein n=3 Tax=root TaxID=1 RepID=A0A7V1BIX9_9RHOB|nr:hypothetical protein [Sulfitobacter litoralis]
MSFRRHIMSSMRNAKRNALHKIVKTITSISDGAADGARDAALNQLATSHWMIMSDTAGTPAAEPDVVRAWSNRGPERVLRDARDFLIREADMAIEKTDYNAKVFAERAIFQISRCLSKTNIEDVHVELLQAAELLHEDLKRILSTHEVASADTIVIPVREICGLDGQPDARGKDAGDTEAAIEVAHCMAEGLRLEAEARELARISEMEEISGPS